jgi:hypothetical protein
MKKQTIDCSTGEVAIIDMTQNEIDAAQASYDAGTSRRIMAQIAALEAQQTPRRMREALSDPTFINDLEEQIAALRNIYP